MRRLALVAALVAVTAGHAAPATARNHPGTRKPQARASAEALALRAKLHFDAGRFDRAAADYLAAYRLYPAAGLLYNLAQSYRLAGECGAARSAYQEYLRRAPDSKLRPLVERHLEAVSTCADSETVIASDAPLPLTGRSLRVAGVITGGAGIVLAGLGVYVASSDDDPAVVEHGRDRDDDDDPASGAGAAGDRDLLGGALIGGGAAACLAGITMFILGSRTGDERGLSLAPNGDGVELAVSWRF
jgi:tetratricopeptide (TPR) repeat protein